MTQISRPFQIALVAMGLFVAVWFVALRGQSSSSSSSPATPSSPASPASKGSVYHGSAPGVEGLTRDIQKARGAVSQSQQNAQQQQRQSDQASSTQSQSQAQSQSQTQSQSNAGSQSSSRQSGGTQAGKAAGAAGASSSSAAAKNMQATVESELKQGKVVTILFYNPKASVDVKVRRELNALGHALGGKIAVHDALANQVGSFGSFTRTVQVYGTPTILIVNKDGKTTSLTGLTDVFSLKQAIAEAKSAR